ncbi:MAG: PilT/PilU family type 4a pilus ATPase [Myxococcota bacterium]|nr:PilT/PilU family type 4a pilus ATPase [Myxococcota bacterium]
MELEALNRLLTVGVQNGASDIHFRPGDTPTYRVNGTLRPLKGEKLTAAETKSIALHFIRDALVRNQIEMIQEYDTSYSVPGSSRFRVNIYRQRGSFSCVLRIIAQQVPTLESLGLPPVLQTIAQQERGLILVTGATGSGKSSTLAAMIDFLNKREALHILTIEDPIEFIHNNQRASVSQREIGIDTENFNIALRAALRQDPDVILVGEMRDTETIDIALKAAETGHLVLSTVHTTDAAKTINRLVSVFSAEEQPIIRMRLADNLKAVISQRLLPKASGQGRVLAVEVMMQNKSVQEYIADASRTAGLKDVIERSRSDGMQSFDQHLADLFRAQVISLETARSAASNPTDFERALNFD